ncbi:MAG: dipeptidase [Chloroflexota bacterium]
MSSAHEYAKAHSGRFLEDLKHLIRIPSVSTQPKHAADVRRAADWLEDRMQKIGFETVEQIDMPGGRHPLVFGTWSGAGADAPTVLIYCHYDVQPAVVEDGWHTSPFEPTEKDGILYGRGATDSKINVMTQLSAIESLLASPEKSPVNIKLILEGEEESGGETINAFVAQHADRLAADVSVISDGPIVNPDQPSMVVGLRGIVALEMHVQGPVRDLHSGHFGGNVHNPIQALTEILAQLHDENGTVTVPGFYDDVPPIDPAEREAIAAANPFYDKNWEQTAAAPAVWGEAGYTIQEKAGLRPTLEINGIWGGYAGHGVKTVLPSKAGCKITCRLVPDQEPQKIFNLIQAEIERLTPPTVTVDLTMQDMGSTALRLPYDSKAVKTANIAYENNWGVPTVMEVAGGSVPISSTFANVTEEVVMMGYAHKGGQAHGPNENIYLSMFDKGIGTAIDFLRLYGQD